MAKPLLTAEEIKNMSTEQILKEMNSLLEELNSRSAEIERRGEAGTAIASNLPQYFRWVERIKVLA
jgi:hypothetical protein